MRVSISLFAFFIFNKFSSISSVLLSGVILPISDRNLFMTLFVVDLFAHVSVFGAAMAP